MSTAKAVQITEFPLMPDSKPGYITEGAGGNLWFIDNGTNEIGRITPAGAVSEFGVGLTAGDGLSGIAPGPEGNVWFTEREGHQVGRITPEGIITLFKTGLTEEPEIYDIAAGPEGNMWFTETFNHKIGVINPTTDKISELPAKGGAYTSIVKGPDNNLWYTNSAEASISRMTPTGMDEQFGPLFEHDCAEIPVTVPKTPCPYPNSITVGGDGNLWFNEARGNAIGRITPLGAISEFSAGLTRNAAVYDMAAGPEGNVWFTENSADQVGRVTSAGVITEFSAGLSSAGGPYGIALGGDENLWVTESTAGKIARVIPDVPPIVVTGGASSVSSSGGTLGGTVRSRGADAHYDIEYGTTTSYGASTASSDNGAGDNTQAAGATLGGLAPATTYHYRLVASNASGTSNGSDQTFTTQPAPPLPPKVTVGQFEMYFSGYRSGRGRLRITQIVVLEAARGDRVSYTCEKCHGSPTHGTQVAYGSKVMFRTRDLLVSGRSLVQITVAGTDGSRRVRTYSFLITQAELELKSQYCFLPHGVVAVTCPGSPTHQAPAHHAKHKHKPSRKEKKPSAKHKKKAHH